MTILPSQSGEIRLTANLWIRGDGGAVAQDEGLLIICLADRLRADDGADAVFLQRRSKELGGRIGISVHENGHRQLDTGSIGIIDILVALIVHGAEQRASGRR